jgi:ankyrin repeat protein
MRIFNPGPILLLGTFVLVTCIPLRSASPAPAIVGSPSGQGGRAQGGKTDPKAKAVDIPALIDRLGEISEADTGYSASVTGSTFLPLDTHGQVHTALLFQKPLAPSNTMRELVKHGAAALPHLMKHLNDGRRTKVKVKHMGFGLGGLWFSEEFDRNDRTDRPLKVKKRQEKEKGDEPRQTSHTVTVGDLCFVAVGQIVNRGYNAVRYQPTAIIVVNSPTRSPDLADWVKQSWGSLTPKQHRAALIADFVKADHDGRRIGACKRLAYYYPDALEPLVLEFLARPTYGVFTVEDFVRNKLYREPDPKKCQALFDAFLARHGEASRDGILLQLFGDLGTLEANEQKRLSPPLKEFGDQPRKLLIQLYGKPKGVKSEDVPRVDTLSDASKYHTIREGLIYDRSEKVDRAMRDRLASGKDDDWLAHAYVQRLIGRGYDAEIEAYCRRRLKQVKEKREREEMEEVLNKLGWTRLHVAVDRNDADALRELLHGKAKVDAAARNGKSPLHLAAAAGNLEIIRLLAEAGSALDRKDEAGLTPVQQAAREGHPEVVRFLAGRGCAIPDVQVAASTGRADLVQGFLRADAAAVKQKSKSGQTPLHLAARAGHVKVVGPVLTAGLAVDARDEEGLTALHVAAASGSDAVARELLRRKADVRAAIGESGIEPLHLAAANGHVKAAEALLDAKAAVGAAVKETKVTPLHLAAAGGHADLVKLLLRRGAGVGATDAEGRTPLHLAALANRVSAAEQLLAAKAAVGAKDRMDATPLHLAAEEGHLAMARLLLSHGASVTARDFFNLTPLDVARRERHPAIVKLLERVKTKG